jgi:hypothetical protein
VTDPEWAAATSLHADEHHMLAGQREAENRLADSAWHRASEITARQGRITEPRSEEHRDFDWMYRHQHLYAEATRRNAWVPYVPITQPHPGPGFAGVGAGAAKVAAG